MVSKPLFFNWLYGCIFTISLLIINTCLCAPSVVTSGSEKELRYLGKKISYLIDEKNAFRNVTDLLYAEPVFKPSDHDILNFNLLEAPIWLTLTIDSRLAGKYFINIDNPNIDSIFFYFPINNGMFRCQKAGYQFPLKQDEATFFSGFTARIPDDIRKGTFPVYIRIISKELMYLPVSVGTKEAIYNTNNFNLFFDALYIGVFLAMLLYNIFIYFSTRDKTYMYYVVYVAFNFMYMNFVKGFGLFMPDPLKKFLGDYNNSLVAVAEITFILFSISFLNLSKTDQKWTYRFFSTLIFICFGVIVLDLFRMEILGAILVEINLLLASFIMIPTAIYLSNKGFITARLYIAGLVTFLLCVIIYVFTLFNLIPFNSLSLYILPFGCSVEVVMLSLALGDKINKLQKDKSTAEKENLDLIKEQNQRLEVMVFERTLELENSNRKLAKQNELIEAQKHTVEQEVAAKTLQLKEALDILLKKNEDLQQFSYIISHNLRSPIASILGLVSIFNRKEHTDPENIYIVDKLNNSVTKLDTVIKDLNTVISIRDSTLDKTREKIDVNELVKNICEGLQTEIELSKTAVQINIDPSLVFKSVKSYLYSIIYNLISNAIKYRNPQKDPVISITIKKIKGGHGISVADNGLGIDLKDKESIFMLYKRLHTHVEGKGMGLYLVKTQIESLKGTIDVEAGIDGGTKFKIFLPAS